MPLTLTVGVSRRAVSAVTPRREKLKLVRCCCSSVPVRNASAAVPNDARLTERAEDPVFVEPELLACRRLGDSSTRCGRRLTRGEQVDRAVLAEQVAAADLEERARRDLELLGDAAAPCSEL